MSPSTPPLFTVRDAVYDVLRSYGGTKIFGNPGSTELPMFRNFPDDIQYVLGLQESVVVAMADGYAQATRRVAFVNLHSAAGVGNGMGTLYTAFKNRTPLVIIAGQQARSILPFDPFLASEDAVSLPKPYVKWSIEPARAEDVPLAIATACQRALQAPCGPVLVSVPADDWDRPAQPVLPRTSSHQIQADPAVVAVMAQALAACRRPAFVVGAEIDRGQAWDAIVTLAEQHQARVYAAAQSSRCAFPEDHPLYMGVLPSGPEGVVAALAENDLVAVIGAPVFTYHIDGQPPYIRPGTQVFQITEDAASAARAAVGTSLVGSVGPTLRQLLAHPAGAPARPAPPRRVAPPRAEPGRPMSVAYALQTLAQWRRPTDIVVEEAPSARPVMQAYLPMLRPDSYYAMASGGLGFGIAAAVGVAMAQPEHKVIALIGDGSFMYSPQAVWNAVQERLNMTFVVLNNGRYAAMDRFGKVLGFPPDEILPGTQLPGLDFVALAHGQGCAGERLENPADLPEAWQRILAQPGPYLLELIVA